jgi:hypothetical protein
MNEDNMIVYKYAVTGGIDPELLNRPTPFRTENGRCMVTDIRYKGNAMYGILTVTGYVLDTMAREDTR